MFSNLQSTAMNILIFHNNATRVLHNNPQLISRNVFIRRLFDGCTQLKTVSTYLERASERRHFTVLSKLSAALFAATLNELFLDECRVK